MTCGVQGLLWQILGVVSTISDGILVEGAASWPGAASSSHRAYQKGLCSDGLCPAARAWEPPAHFYLQFANVGCKTQVETWTKMGSKTVSLPSSDPRAWRFDPLKRRPASCSPRNGGGLLGVWVVVFGQQQGGKSRASLMFAVVLSFTAPCWSGSAVFSTEFLDKAQFFPWPTAALISEMWLWCILCLHAM